MQMVIGDWISNTQKTNEEDWVFCCFLEAGNAIEDAVCDEDCIQLTTSYTWPLSQE